MIERIARIDPTRLGEIRRMAHTTPLVCGVGELCQEIAALEHELEIAQGCAIRDARAVIGLALDRDAARAERDTWELRAWRLGWDRD